MNFFLIIFLLIFNLTLKATDVVNISTGEAGQGWSKTLKNNGYILHLTRRAFALKGIEIKLLFFPWKRAYALPLNNGADATCCWFYTKKRAKEYFYSDPIHNETMYFFHLKSTKLNLENFSDLRKKRIGLREGFHYGNKFEKELKSGRIITERVGTNQQLFQMLLSGRIDAFPVALDAGIFALKKYFRKAHIKQITYHQTPLKSRSLHLLFPRNVKAKRNKYLLEKFNSGLGQLKKSDEYLDILSDIKNGLKNNILD